MRRSNAVGHDDNCPPTSSPLVESDRNGLNSGPDNVFAKPVRRHHNAETNDTENRKTFIERESFNNKQMGMPFSAEDCTSTMTIHLPSEDEVYSNREHYRAPQNAYQRNATDGERDYSVQTMEIREGSEASEMSVSNASFSSGPNDVLNQQWENRRFRNYFNNQRSTDPESDENEESVNREGDIQEHFSVQYSASRCKTFAGLPIVECFKGAKVKVGQRVVRGNNWEYGDADGGNGGIGIVIAVNQETVRVQWDTKENSDNPQIEYRIGKDGKYDLKLFDNAQTGVIHPTSHCHICEEKPFRGIRWRCRQCKDYDLCTDCYMSNKHDTSHAFERKQMSQSVCVQISPRRNSKQSKAIGIIPHATVALRRNLNRKGIVQKYVENISTLYNCDALVTIEDEPWPRRFQFGRNGKSELKYREPFQCEYYEKHLPDLDELRDGPIAGLRVVRVSAPSALEKLGTITLVQNYENNSGFDSNTTEQQDDANSMQVQWDDGTQESFQRSGKGLKLFDTSQIGVKHQKWCCKCEEANHIKGILWECTICSESTLCTLCYMDDRGCLNHEHKRVIEIGGCETKKGPREKSKRKKKKMLGIFVGTEVASLDDSLIGKVKKLCSYKIDIGRHAVEIKWSDASEDNKTDIVEIIDLISLPNGIHDMKYYPHDLPDLGNDTRGYLKVSNDIREALISLWFNENQNNGNVQNENQSNGNSQNENQSNGHTQNENQTRENTQNENQNNGNTQNENQSNGNIQNENQSTENTQNENQSNGNTQNEIQSRGNIQNENLNNGNVQNENQSNGNTQNENQSRGNAHNRNKSSKQAELLNSLRPKLYVIFADNPNTSDNKESSFRRHVKEIQAFAKTSHNPCYLVARKILFYNENIVVHKNTDNFVIQTLVSMTISTIHRGDSNDEEEEILYFKRMLEKLCNDLLISVVVSLGNGKTCNQVLQFAMEKDEKTCRPTPIIFFKTFGDDASVLTDIDIYQSSYYKGFEHQFSMKAPWTRQNIQSLKINTTRSYATSGNEIVFLSDIRYEQWLTFDAILCYLLIGVILAAESDQNVFGKLTNEYSNALSMYLLKEGKWKIPRDVIEKRFSEKLFNKKSIEYIGEQSVEKQISEGLWTDLQEFAKGHYLPSTWSKTIQEEKGFKEDVNTPDKDCGLIFYALLLQKHYNGAKQWIRTGFVSVRPILVGAFILQQEKKKWQTGELERNNLEQMHKTLTQDAIRIISCIHEVENRRLPKDTEDNAQCRDKISGENVLHSGRVLLNHECLSDAIETENRMFVENEVVKDILNEMWYGQNRITRKEAFMFCLLAFFHLIFLLPLMVFLDTWRFKRLYELYSIPFMKVLNTLLGLSLLLLGYAYMLLFNHEQSISNADIFLIICMTSFVINELKQVCIAIHRKSLSWYIKDPWNVLDWLAFATYSTGMLLKITGGPESFDASKLFLVLSFMMLCIRILHLFCISELLGPKLVIISKMLKDTFAFMAIMMIITMCYNVSYYAILYSGNSEFSFDTFEKVMRNGFWMLFGELNLEGDKLTEPDCSNVKAVYSSGTTERCPSSIGRIVAPYLKALYGFVAVIMMLNLLIAIYSYTFSNVQVQSKFYWSKLQNDFLEEYSLQSIFPFHMQCIAMVVCLFHFIIISACKIRSRSKNSKSGIDDSSGEENIKNQTKTLNQHPTFVRAFFYDTNFDIKLQKTKILEDLAALRANRDVDIDEEDQLTALKDEMKGMLKKNKKALKDGITEMKKNILENNQKMMDTFQNMMRKQFENENSENSSESSFPLNHSERNPAEISD